MSGDFDWSGAPEGERWALLVNGTSRNHYVVRVNEETGRETAMLWSGTWMRSMLTPAVIRRDGTRVDSARPVPRVGDRVRVTVEGTVMYNDQSLEQGSFEINVPGNGGRFFWPEKDGARVEVLHRADPPLHPGDLVRDGEGAVWQLEQRERFVPLIDHHGVPRLSKTWCPREELPGPLVKVELREVQA